jgi:hypothetical protein
MELYSELSRPLLAAVDLERAYVLELALDLSTRQAAGR